MPPAGLLIFLGLCATIMGAAAKVLKPVEVFPELVATQFQFSSSLVRDHTQLLQLSHASFNTDNFAPKLRANDDCCNVLLIEAISKRRLRVIASISVLGTIAAANERRFAADDDDDGGKYLSTSADIAISGQACGQWGKLWQKWSKPLDWLH